jgi:kynurenine 3-monooxygenase
MTDSHSVIVIGGGLAGSLLAIELARQGQTPGVIERRSEFARDTEESGRSINLALSARGIAALERCEVLSEIEPLLMPMKGRMVHAPDGDSTFAPYGQRELEIIYSVSRAALNQSLYEHASSVYGVDYRFRTRFADIDPKTSAGQVQGPEGALALDARVVLAADGAGSAVREALRRRAGLEVREIPLGHGYKELSIPPTADGRHALDPTALHIWPRGGFMLIALPNADASFTATLFLSRDGDPGFGRLHDWPRQRRFMQEHFPDAMPLLIRLEADFHDNPVGLLGTIRCRRWHVGGRAALIGDAAHAVVPFHGQGMNAAFEDCVELVRSLDEGLADWQTVFEAYQRRRLDNANAIADMALENYRVMREAVREPRFLLRKQLEHELERRHPGRFVARYSLVMFHRVPYAEAYRRGAVQARLLDRLLEGAETLDDVDFALAARLVEARLTDIVEPA